MSNALLYTTLTNRVGIVPPEQRASYAAIIDDILATADLLTISAKRIRKALQEKVDYDLASQKVTILLRFTRERIV